MTKRLSKLGVALVAVFAIGLVGCSQSDSNPLSSTDADLMTTRVGLATADAAGGPSKDTDRPMAAKKMKRTGPPLFGLANKSGLSTLAFAVEAVGLNKTLNTGGPFTVFAPTNEAFAALPEGTLEALLEDPETLTNILLYHVAAGELMAADVVGLTEIEMVNGDTVSVSVNGGVMVNDATVIATDILGKNGVVHVIDKVLLP
jgi:uncharacterized surface protein with fasciclin (FAS1) repeats